VLNLRSSPFTSLHRPNGGIGGKLGAFKSQNELKLMKKQQQRTNQIVIFVDIGPNQAVGNMPSHVFHKTWQTPGFHR